MGLSIRRCGWSPYRLVAALAYNTGVLFVKFIGTHRAYDAIDAETVEPE